MDSHIVKELRSVAAVRLLNPLLLLAAISFTDASASALSSPVLVKDINPGSAGSSPRSVLALGSKLFFASTDGVNGIEPWVSDATGAGTTLLNDVWAGAASGIITGCPTCGAIHLGSFVYFSAYNETGRR